MRWHSDLAARLPKVAADFPNGVGGPQPSATEEARPEADGSASRRPRAHEQPGPPAHRVPTAAGDRPRRARLPVRVVVLVGAFMALLDTTIVNVALPSIRTGLHASSASLEWIVSVYALAYGPAGAGRPGWRPVRPQAPVPDRADHLHPGQRGLRPRADQTRSSPPGSCRAWGPGCSTRRSRRPFSSPSPARPAPGRSAYPAPPSACSPPTPLLGGLIIAAAGARDGWRWVFLVNLFIGAVTVPLAAWRLPRPATRTRAVRSRRAWGCSPRRCFCCWSRWSRVSRRAARLVLAVFRRVRGRGGAADRLGAT